jgi:hypothetical protein
MPGFMDERGNWAAAITDLEEREHYQEGLLRKNGSKRGKTEQMLTDAIAALAAPDPPPLTAQAISRAMQADRGAIRDLAKRDHFELVPPLIGMSMPVGHGYLTAASRDGRTGAELRADGDSEPTGVHNEPRVAPKERLLGWALADATDHDAFALETLRPVLAGMRDDPARTGRAISAPVTPAEVLMEGYEIVAMAERVAADCPRTAAGAREHMRLPLIVGPVSYGFRPKGRELLSAERWMPGLDPQFVRWLGGLAPREGAAFAFTLARVIPGEISMIERIRLASGALSGSAFASALLAGVRLDPEPVEVAESVARVRGVVLQDVPVNLLIVAARGRHRLATAWTIRADMPEAAAQRLGYLLARHEVLAIDRGIRDCFDRHGILKVSAKKDAQRRFLRTLALAGHAQRSAR